jgi:hypothetical protein
MFSPGRNACAAPAPRAFHIFARLRLGSPEAACNAIQNEFLFIIGPILWTGTAHRVVVPFGIISIVMPFGSAI